MAGGKRIKGITIEIDGETKGLDKALSGIDRNLSKTQTSLNDVNRLLKLDPTNTQLLAQKQQLLQTEIGDTKTRLDALKQAEKQVQEQMKQGTASQEQYDALQREIVETEQKLKGLNTSLKEIGNIKIQEVSAKIQDVGTKAEAAGQKIAPLSAAAAGVGAAAVKSFKDVDDGLDTIVKKTGAVGPAADKFKEIFESVATDVPADLSEIGAAIGEINTRFDFTGKKLEESTKKFLKFAEINDTDVESAIRLVSRAMGDAGIPAENYANVLDQLTVAGQKSGISIDTLSENLAKYGAPMRALGLDTKQSIAIFAGWEKAGVNTEIAFSGMKKAISNWGKEGKDATVEFQKTLQAIKDAPDIASATSLAIEAFGAKAGPDLADAIQNGRFEIDEYMTALQNAGGSVDQTFGETEDGIDRAKTTLNAVKIALSGLGSVMSDVVGPIFDSLAKKIESFTKWFSTLSDGQKKVIVSILAFVAALGPLLIFFGKMAFGLNSIISLFSKFSGAGALFSTFASGISTVATKLLGIVKVVVSGIGIAVKGLFSLIMAHPVIAIITAIIAIVIVLYNKCAWFRDGVNAILANIKEFFQSFGDKVAGIKDKIVTAFTNMVTSIKTKAGNIKDAIVDGFNSAINFITSLPQKAYEWGKDFIQQLINGIKSMISSISGAVSDIADKIRSFLHFSVPDEGPLVDAPTWMPDMIDLMIGGIKKNQPKLQKAMKTLAGSMRGSVAMDASFTDAAAAAGSQEIVLQNTVMLDGTPVYNKTERHISQKQQSSMRARGIR